MLLDAAALDLGRSSRSRRPPSWSPSCGAQPARTSTTRGLAELVGELSVRSDLFRRLWARHDVRRHPGGGVYRVQHPQVGELELRFDKFAVADAADQVLVVYQAEPGSRSAEALALLSTLAGPALSADSGLDGGHGGTPTAAAARLP